MCEFIFKHLLVKNHISDVSVYSAGTSGEEEGNPMHYAAKDILRQKNIPTEQRRAVKLQKNDYGRFDYIIGLDGNNLKAMHRLFGVDRENKLYRLLSFCGSDADVADPWWTGDFSTAYEDCLRGCTAFFEYLRKKGRI